MRHLPAQLACALACTVAFPALGQDGTPGGPNEEEMFGNPSGPPASQAPQPSERLVTSAASKDNPLALGGILYLRLQSSWQEGVKPKDWRLASPNLVDLYLDARPNDRVRGFVLARTSYDPTLGTAQPAATTTGSTPVDLTGTAASSTANPRGTLDQLWINFDMGRRAFVTVGKQHVKWGVGRFWNPTDYLHPVKRDPLAVFDVRTGQTMVKVHVPWEQRGWNFYGVALLEDVAGQAEGVNRAGRIAPGARAELVLGGAELGLDALAQSGHKPRFGVDVSAGIWDLDVYAEAALRNGVDVPRWRDANPEAPPLTPGRFLRADPTGFTPQVTLGVGYSRNYSDQDAVTFGLEYFYDRSGYDSSHVYPWLVAAPFVGRAQLEANPNDAVAAQLAREQPFSPFYLGRHYAGVSAFLPAPGSWNDHTFTLSFIGNLSDRSFVARLDHAVLALTYLRIESYVQGHLGRKGGEFRFGVDVPGVASLPAPVLDLGVALRVNL